MKRLKDPIYGYINLNYEVVNKIIDTPNFQRLRYIMQTSYSPLYPSSVHNRFAHSLGVMYLGELAAKSIQRSLSKLEILSEDRVRKYIQVFLYACLLHDIGHAPFSHTGEGFYLTQDEAKSKLHQEIGVLAEDSLFEDEKETKNFSAAPHELMSVIVALKAYASLFEDTSCKGFFARCILGYQYLKEINEEKSILNCFISMLNSKLIDVDKLDYLIRDAYFTGFNTVAIDYERLLSSTIICNTDDAWELAFEQGALTVIENAIYAHDSERKWIQDHPAIQYDAYLLKHGIEVINVKISNLFTYDCLTEGGKEIDNGGVIRLLNDTDIMFLMKNITDDALVKEYFSRNDRRHPFWKSESEYKAIFNTVYGSEVCRTIEEEFDELVKVLNSLKRSAEINIETLKALQNEIAELKKLTDELEKSDKDRARKYSKQIVIKEKHLRWVNCLYDFSVERGIDFDFAVISAKQFNSGFGNIEFEKIKIKFWHLNVPSKFVDISNALTSRKSDREGFFYLFYRRKEGANAVNPNELAKALNDLALSEIQRKRIAT